jgi:hypothetical protein
MHLMVISLFCICLLSISVIFLDIDPVYLLLKWLSLNPTDGSFCSFFLLVFRLVFVTLLVQATLRSVSFVMLWVLLVLKMMHSCIEISGKKISVTRNSTSTFRNFQNNLYLQQSLNQVVFGYLRVFSSPFAVAIMSAGLGVEIIVVFAVIRLRILIEVAWPIYVGLIIGAIVIPLLADAELPEATRIYDKTEAILRTWKLKMTLEARGDKRYYFKKIASLRPCSMYAGLGDVVFFPLRKCTKSTYYALMIYYIVNTLISIPDSFTLRL